MLTWRPQETNFLTFFGSKRNFFPDKFASFIVSAPCTSNKTTILGVRATSKSYSKNTKRFSADRKTTKTKFFDVFLAQNAIFFCVKLPFLLFEHLAQLLRRLSWEFQQHRSLTVKLRSVLVKTGRHQKTNSFDVFWLKTKFFFPVNLNFFFII